MRKDELKIGQVYHICTKSIAGYRIFRNDDDYSRMVDMLWYYIHEDPPTKYSLYLEAIEKGFLSFKVELAQRHLICDIIAYCIMPTHIHLIVCQQKENGISTFMKNLLNSYSRYFNTKYIRKGPLWQGRFKSILVETDEQLLHLTRYIHLNPTSDGLVSKPEDWTYSSYTEYLEEAQSGITNYKPYLCINPSSYKAFVEDRQDYQKRIAEIKRIIFE